MIIETEMTIKTLKDLVSSGEKHFKRVEITEYGKIRNFNFSEVIFEECMLSLDFTGSSFRSAKFINSNIKNSIFSETDLSNSEFFNNSIDACVFRNANIEGIIFLKNTQYSSENTIEDLKEMVKK
ncbi:pentapeptide repeat-containing protein [Paenibacillus sp. FSL K6-2862]|uniref:pentapeptide repeat-containing protein n=1 Tax=Paenibacillus sp. FSL K6-2862 TaxID=2921484 RepID=UPI0030FCC235